MDTRLSEKIHYVTISAYVLRTKSRILKTKQDVNKYANKANIGETIVYDTPYNIMQL